MYKVELSIKAKKQLYKLNRILKHRIVKNLERIRVRPHAYIKKLVGSPYYSLRVGDYRIILDVQDGKLIIFVIELGHRKNIYQRGK